MAIIYIGYLVGQNPTTLQWFTAEDQPESSINGIPIPLDNSLPLFVSSNKPFPCAIFTGDNHYLPQHLTVLSTS